jgi:hypothetical protein
MGGVVVPLAAPPIEGTPTPNITILNRGTLYESLPPLVLPDKYLEEDAHE